VEFLFYDHPAGIRRVERALEFEQDPPCPNAVDSRRPGGAA